MKMISIKAIIAISSVLLRMVFYNRSNLFIFILFLLISCKQSQILVEKSSIIFKYNHNIKSILYTNKDNPIIHITSEGRGVEYDIPYLIYPNRGIILVHEEIPYEGIQSAITIYNSRGEILKSFSGRPGYVIVSPDGHIFSAIEEPFVNFTGKVFFYNYKGQLIKDYRFTEYGPESGNARFSDNSQFFIVNNGGGWQNVPCKYVLFTIASENLVEINLPDPFCGNSTDILFSSRYFGAFTKDIESNINQLYIYSTSGELIGKSIISHSDIDKLLTLIKGEYKITISKYKLIINDKKGNKVILNIY